MIADGAGGKNLQINSSNCVYCKACDIKEPYPDRSPGDAGGGSGPNYRAFEIAFIDSVQPSLVGRSAPAVVAAGRLEIDAAQGKRPRVSTLEREHSADLQVGRRKTSRISFAAGLARTHAAACISGAESDAARPCLDCFYESARNKTRAHSLYRFMRQVHAELRAATQHAAARANVERLARTTRALSDEFCRGHADAMILAALFEGLFRAA